MTNPLRQWMVPRRQRMAFHAANPNLPNPFFAAQQRQWYTPGYGMQPMGNGPPPPQYGTPEWLPAYAPPADGANVNATKTSPDQTYRHEAGATGPSQPPNSGAPAARL